MGESERCPTTKEGPSCHSAQPPAIMEITKETWRSLEALAESLWRLGIAVSPPKALVSSAPSLQRSVLPTLPRDNASLCTEKTAKIIS